MPQTLKRLRVPVFLENSCLGWVNSRQSACTSLKLKIIMIHSCSHVRLFIFNCALLQVWREIIWTLLEWASKDIWHRAPIFYFFTSKIISFAFAVNNKTSILTLFIPGGGGEFFTCGPEIAHSSEMAEVINLKLDDLFCFIIRINWKLTS